MQKPQQPRPKAESIGTPGTATGPEAKMKSESIGLDGSRVDGPGWNCTFLAEGSPIPNQKPTPPQPSLLEVRSTYVLFPLYKTNSAVQVLKRPPPPPQLPNNPSIHAPHRVAPTLSLQACTRNPDPIPTTCYERGSYSCLRRKLF